MNPKILLVFSITIYYVSFSSGFARRKRSLGNIYIKTWTNSTIPYFINPSFSDADLFYVKRAMDMYAKETCLRFEPYKPDLHPNWLKIDDSDKCHSEIGMKDGGQQTLLMAKTCRNFGLILHELAHTIGVLHEMMRPDRNQFIHVYTENIQDEAIDGFSIDSQHYKLLGTPFDFQSVTMYSPYDFSKNGLPVWTKLNSSDLTPIFDSREKDISFWDIKAINEMYNCAGHCQKVKCSYPNFLTKNCTCETPEAFADRRCIDDPNYKDICKNASADDSCYNKPIISSTVCRKTCGRCFRYGKHGMSSPPIYNCVDHNAEQCKRNKLDGYCFTDTWTKVNCKMSCKKCEAHADPSIIEFKCKDRHNSDLCEEWASNRQCEENPGFMKSNCALSCGTCVSNSSVTKPMAPCRNYSPDSYCDAMAKENKCEGTTVKICLGSCGKCGTNYERNEANITESEIERVHKMAIKKVCKDMLSDCVYFAKLGHCQTHKESMMYHCNKSCNFCNESDCSNIDSEHVCDDVKQRGLCKLHAGFATRCKKTCGQCKVIANVATVVNTCQDKESKYICEELVRRGQCRVDVNRSRRCIKSCNLCNSSYDANWLSSNKPYPMTSTSIPCTNEESDDLCERLRSNGWCQSYLDRAVMCRRSCNLCDPGSSKKLEREVTKTICKDEDDVTSCKSWESAGYCSDNRDYMMSRCALTCGFCEPIPDLHTTCSNAEVGSVCESWAKERFCELNPEYMKERCKKACKFCSEDVSTSTAQPKPLLTTTTFLVRKCENVEENDTCQTWKERGICVDYFNYMRINCALTCNLCESNIPSNTTRLTVVSTTTTRPCLNSQSDDTCESWKQGGYCSLDYIAEMCKKSCEKCAMYIVF